MSALFRVLLFGLLLLSGTLGRLAFAETQAGLTGLDIMETMSQRHSHPFEYELLTITRTNADGSRVVRKGRRYTRLEQGVNPTNRYLLVFDSPEPILGVAFLIRSMAGGIRSHWVYLPAMQSRMQRVAGGGGGGIFDTDFSVEDLANEDFSRFIYQRKADLMYKKRPHFMVEAHPGRMDSRWPSHYGYRRIFVDQDQYQINRIDYYDQDGALLKRRSNKSSGGKISGLSFRPEVTRMENLQEGTNTTIKTTRRILKEEMVPEAIFERHNIEKGMLLESKP
jgi:hypothetical protein